MTRAWLVCVIAATMASALHAAPAGAPGGETNQHLGSDLVELHETAVANLEQICDDYRRIKAIQQSRQLDIPFAEAYDNIASVMPVLPPINTELLRRAIRDPRDIAGHKNEVINVEEQVEIMIDLAAKLLEEIEVMQVRLLAPGTELQRRDKTLDEIVQQAEYDPEKVIEITRPLPPHAASATLQELEELARDDEEQPYKDLTPLMHALMPDIKDLTGEMRADEKRPVELFRSADSPGRFTRLVNPDVHMAFGRTIGAGGVPAEWLFVNSWYTIGPFPNPMRVNIHTKFPPETVIDLAATYPGKNGMQVSWQWIQGNEPMLQPAGADQYGIYYAYTEVRCAQPMDLWVAIGSDDKANVWLNGLPIWVSSDRLKGWRINEGFRKVTFRQGVNRVLFRVENGWLTLGFSFGICVAP